MAGGKRGKGDPQTFTHERPMTECPSPPNIFSPTCLEDTLKPVYCLRSAASTQNICSPASICITLHINLIKENQSV